MSFITFLFVASLGFIFAIVSAVSIVCAADKLWSNNK